MALGLPDAADPGCFSSARGNVMGYTFFVLLVPVVLLLVTILGATLSYPL